MVTALYRRYRPETFAEVIGQEHVTAPLSVALDNNRVGHAYLFSGPRGCGKTTSARILARCLNCEQGPTSTPCGACESCVALARGGPGSLDVIEIDAASHRGIDDAREIRERAVFAPASSRYKIFIIDEAHMVTKEGFNALLKIVEEPPAHVKFVFATTEPEKVIGTIRSRTHHYPFRLVPPGVLQTYLGEVCEHEGVRAGQGVLPLVVRAGAGSVRDSMSVLDQLIAGSGPDGLEYGPASALLGYTDAGLLDATVDALAAVDGAALFTVVDRVIESGFDPRRFAEDLLERLRDLVIAEAVPDGTAAVLQGVPEDQLERMRAQASRFGRAELSRAADTVNIAVTEMTGATSPRLQLELLCARLLLPGADAGGGLGARLDRVERRLAAGGPVETAAAPPAPVARPVREPAPEIVVETPVAAAQGRPAPVSPPPVASPPVPPTQPPPAVVRPTAAPPAAAARPAPGGMDLDGVRRVWPDVLGALSGLKRATWSLVSQHAELVSFDGERLILGFKAPNLAASFNRGAHQELTRQALIDVAGLDAKVEAVVGNQPPAARGGGAPAGRAPEPPRQAPAPRPAQTPAPAARPEPQRPAPARPAPPAGRPYPADDDIPLPDEPPPDEPPVPDDSPRRAPQRPAAPPPRAAAPPAPPPPPAAYDDEPSMDDADVEGSNLVGAPVVEQLLGGRVIEEHDA